MPRQPNPTIVYCAFAHDETIHKTLRGAYIREALLAKKDTTWCQLRGSWYCQKGRCKEASRALALTVLEESKTAKAARLVDENAAVIEAALLPKNKRVATKKPVMVAAGKKIKISVGDASITLTSVGAIEVSCVGA